MGFAVLVLAVGYLYWHPPGDVVEAENATIGKLAALSARVDQLDQRPAPDLSAYDKRFAGLESRLAGLEARPVAATTDLGPLSSRLDAFAAKLDATAAKADASASKSGDIAAKEDANATKLDAMASRADATASKLESGAATLNGRLDALDKRVGGAEALAKSGADAASGVAASVDAKVDAKVGSAAGALDAKFAQSTAQLSSQVDAKVGSLTETARRLASIQVVGAALEAGQKLGPIPGAPPALARFADQAPPTEFALRQSFATAAAAALRTSELVVANDKPFLDRLWTRAQQSVSVREGDRVLVGDPVAATLARARKAVEGNDLAAALSVLQGLSGLPKDAMADWMSQAQALLDARAAVAQLAAHG